MNAGADRARSGFGERARNLFLFARVVDAHVLVIAALAVAATWLSIRWGVRARLPSELLTTAVVFPIVFAINASYKRREDALRQLGAVRAALASIWLAHRDLPTTGDGEHVSRAAPMVRGLYAAVVDVACAGGRCPPDAEAAVAQGISDLSRSIVGLRASGVAPPDVARVQNHLNAAVNAFEVLRAILQYRTPTSLRAHSKLFLNLFPVLYAPLYAQIASEAGAAFGYALAVAFAVVLVGLDNIQAWLEHPFDSIGEDDVRVDAEADMIWLKVDEGPRGS